MKKFLIAGAGVAVLAASAAIAQTAPTPSAPQPQLRDNVQTRDQVVQRVRDHFARMDLNRDGFVTREEGQSAATQMRGQRAEKRAQRQADPAQQTERNARAFDRLDLNRNGVITRDEFAQARTMRGDRGPGQAMRMRGAMGGRMFAMADANRDNRVSLQEATDVALRHFDMADINRDGRVTREERQQARQRMMQDRGVRG